MTGIAEAVAASSPKVSVDCRNVLKTAQMSQKELAQHLWDEYKKQIQAMIMTSEDFPPDLKANLWTRVNDFVPELSDNIALWLKRASDGLLSDGPSDL